MWTPKIWFENDFSMGWVTARGPPNGDGLKYALCAGAFGLELRSLQMAQKRA